MSPGSMRSRRLSGLEVTPWIVAIALWSEPRTALAQAPPPDVGMPQGLRLPGGELTAADNPFDRMRRGRRNRTTGLVLTILGGVHAAITAGTTIALVRCDAGCELASAAYFGASVGAGIVGAHLLGAGIPLLVGGQRQVDRAERLIALLPRDQAGDPIPPPQWTEDAAVVRARAEKNRWKGISLLGVGAFNLALMGGMAGGILYCGSGPRDRCPDLALLGMLPAAVGTGVAGIVTLGAGGAYASDGRRALQMLDQRAPVRGVELSLSIGQTIGLVGRF